MIRRLSSNDKPLHDKLPERPRDQRLPCLGRGLLLLFAVVLPFEAPLFRLGVLQITTVELVLYAMLAVWLADLIAGLRGRSMRGLVVTLLAHPLAKAAAAFAAVLFLSALLAPSDRGPAIKFALRSLSGILVFFSTRSLARPGDVRRVAFAVVLGALLSAITAIVDWLVPRSAILWAPFREGNNFAALGLARASGVFSYPTIGAMYWEAAVPLLVVLPFLTANGSGRKPAPTAQSVLGVAFGSALFVSAILASATRSGLAGTALACLALLGLTWRLQLGARRAAAAALTLTLTLGLGLAAFGSLLGQRLLWWRDDSWYRVEYQVGTTPASTHANASFTVPVTLRNTGVLAWSRAPPSPTHLSYHWERPDGGSATLSDFEGVRTDLPTDVPPGATVDVLGLVRGPILPGTYRLSWDLVQENVSWFSARGNPKAGRTILVEAPDDTLPPTSTIERPGPAINPPSPSRPELWHAAVVLFRGRPILGIGPDNFRRRYEAVLGSAGSGELYTDTRIHANSLYFETLADLGFIGIAALAWIGIALLGSVRRLWRSGRLAGLGSAVAAGTFFVHGALDYFFEFTPLLGLFWLLLGLTAASESAPHGALQGSKR
jgi:hypothetical protein